MRALSDTSHLMDSPWNTQDPLERLYLTVGLRTLVVPSGLLSVTRDREIWTDKTNKQIWMQNNQLRVPTV